MNSKKQRQNLPVALCLAGFAYRLLPEPLKQILNRNSLIRTLLNLFVRTGLTEIGVVRGPLQGARLKLYAKVEKAYCLDIYEPKLVQAIHAFCKSDMVVYDVGANIGYISLVFAQVVGERGRVYAFEPLPQNVTRLQEHIVMNDQDSVITIVPHACSERSETAMFLVHDNPMMGKLAGSTGRKANYDATIEVHCVSLDDFVYVKGNSPPDVIKMDIEGGEIKAFLGMRRILQEVQPTLLLELHGPEAARVVWQLLRSSKYVIHKLAPGYRQIEDPSRMAWKEYLLARPAA